jgi:SNF2 family DNA or RNA helicase
MSLNNIENNKAHHFENIITYLNNYVDKASILVFSNFDGTFKNCMSVFAKMGILNKEIKGTPDQIKHIVNDYESNKIKVLMLNSSNMGFGMNLQTTTDIIIMHKMDSETEKQVVGRAYRIGKKTPLRVWYIYNNTEM